MGHWTKLARRFSQRLDGGSSRLLKIEIHLDCRNLIVIKSTLDALIVYMRMMGYDILVVNS